MDVLLAMDVTTLVVPKVHRFIPFVGNKDMGHKDVGPKDVGQKDVGQKLGAPQRSPSREFPLMSGKETTDPVPCASAVVQTPPEKLPPLGHFGDSP